MREDGGLALNRQWTMLREIPRAPLKVTAAELADRLEDRGFEVTKRTVERDLHALSARFPLALDDRSKPYGWSWMKNAGLEFAPNLTASQSVALLLAKTHLQHLLPRNLSGELAPIFDAAERALAATGWKDWHKRTAIVPATLPLLPPRIDPDTMSQVQAALAQRRCIDAHYRAKGEAIAKSLLVHPLGLLARGSLLYLVCTLFDYKDVRQLALHRLTNVQITEMRRRKLEGFALADYAAGPASAYGSHGEIRLVARFEAAAAEHLLETPLSHDQAWKPIGDGAWVEISATTEDDQRLRWWLLGFGCQVEVVSPSELRSWILMQSATQHEIYRRSSTISTPGQDDA